MQATRRLARFLKPYWLWATLAPLLMIVEVTMDLLQPRLVQQIIDAGVAQGDLQVVLRSSLWMVALAFIGLLGGVGCTVYAVRAAQFFGADVRSSLFGRVQSLSFGNLDKLETGKLITRLTNDVMQVQEMVAMLLRIMVRAPLLLVGSLIMAIVTSPQLAWLFVILIPIVIVALYVIIGRAFPRFGAVQRQLDHLNTVMQENLAGVRVVKAFGREPHELERFHQANDRLVDQSISAMRTTILTMPVMMLTLNAGVAATVWFGGIQVNEGAMQVGQIIAFINYLSQTLMSLMMVSMLTMRLARAEASALRIHEVLESQPEIKNRPDALPTFAPKGRVTFEGVSFAYNGDGEGDEHEPALHDVTLTIEAGQTVALLGATGSGKSSLVKLIPRFYEATAGRVTIDGVDVRDVEETALHRAIGVALQEAVLFSGPIRDNIRFGRPDASEDEVVAAAAAAQAHDFISAFPQGYDTLVGQRGVNLSGGQKQRIAIARGLLTRPSVLILDDSTSAVDVETEARIQEALDRLRAGCTNIIVAQRISSVLNADKIFVLDEGRIVAAGVHDELLVSSPIYREICATQLAPEAISYE